MEWLKLYAALAGKDAEAEAYFAQLMQSLDGVLDQTPTGKRVAFFYITTSGAVNVRKSGDYIAKAIRMAGGPGSCCPAPATADKSSWKCTRHCRSERP